MIPEELDRHVSKTGVPAKFPSPSSLPRARSIPDRSTLSGGLRRLPSVMERGFMSMGHTALWRRLPSADKFDGLDHADSVSLDAHKWLYQPLDCGCLLYRSAEAAQRAFSHSGEYARSLSADPVEGFAFFEESLELSRRFRALKLWLSLRYHGLAAFRDSIANDLAQARRLAESIRNAPLLELLAAGELSAVCFRHRGNAGMSDAELNEFQCCVAKANDRPRQSLSFERDTPRQVLPQGVYRESPDERFRC